MDGRMCGLALRRRSASRRATVVWWLGLVGIAIVPNLVIAQGLPPAVAQQQEESLQFEHAAGMITGRVPAEWYVGEQVVGREVRLVLAPHPPDRRGRLPVTHIWLTVHAGITDVDLSEVLRRRRASTKRTEAPMDEPASSSVPIRWNGFPGEKLVYRSLSPEDLQHVWAVVETPWGLCEWHVQSPDPQWVQGWAATIERDWRVRPPRRLASELAPAQEAARAAIGSWKGSDYRLRLLSTGRFELVWDRRRLTEAGTYEEVLAGSFEAEEDVLRVTFEDGSRRNYRWRRAGAWLLLTDHDGRTAQLRLLYE